MTPFWSSWRGGDQDNSAVNGDVDDAVKFCGTPLGAAVLEKKTCTFSTHSCTKKDFSYTCRMCCHIEIAGEWAQLDGERSYSAFVGIEGMK